MPTFGTVCDGIGCGHLGFVQAGFACAWSAEIEQFPCAVLKHRFPGVPNLGDITADDFIERAEACGHIDVLIGGTPCQAFSVAGKREGVKDPRGRLTFRFIEIAERLKPEFVIWENVPGILSIDDGECFAFFLDELQRLGYITNCDVLDSQFFGVAQRRRRVFVSCQLAETLMKQKTLTSAITLAHTIGELSLDILTAHIVACGSAPVFSDVLCENVPDGLRRKMSPFEKVGVEVFQMWLENSEETFRNVPRDVEPSESRVGLGTKTVASLKRRTAATSSSDSNESPASGIPKSSSNTSLSLKKNWEEVFTRAKSCITSTPSKPTTDPIIWQLFEAVALTAECILPLKDSYPNFSTVGLSFLTTLKEFINYARQTDEPIFTEPGVYRLRGDIVQQAERAAQSLADTRVECFGEVFPLSEGVRRDSPPSREAGKVVTHDAGSGAKFGHWDGGDCHPSLTQAMKGSGGIGASNQELFSQRGSGLVPVHTTGDGYWREGVGTLRAREQDSHENLLCMAHGQANAEICENQSLTLNCNHEVPIAFCASGDVAHSLRGEGFDASEDGTGRGTPLVAFSCKDYGNGAVENLSPTLRAMEGVKPSGGGQMAIAFERRFVRTSGGQPTIDLQPCLRADANTGDGAPCVAFDTTQITSPGNYSRPKQGDPCHPLASGAHPPCVAIQDVRGLDKKQNGRGYNADGTSYTVDAMATQGVANAMQVRRLTPRECERLQGLPDDWTKIPWRGKSAADCPDGPRYKGIGNGQTVNVMRWLAERIKKAIAV